MLFSISWRLLPVSGSGTWQHYVMPAITLGYYAAPAFMRLIRAGMIEVLGADYIRTARAKGLPTHTVIFKHALRNAILPVITAIGSSFGFLLTGSFVVETMFILPGIGRETIEAIQQNNSPVVQACILVTGAMFVGINLLVDMILPILDPRIRESQI
jgi:peptide/nickel transport system permease protein